MSVEDMPRVRLANLPTPLQEMTRLSRLLGGPRLFIKRDDLTGLALGGNKLRMLEYLIGDALNKGADTIITSGYLQSNHCRLTAAAARMAGLEPVIVFNEECPKKFSGNMIINHFFGAKMYFVSAEKKSLSPQQYHEECAKKSDQLVQEISRKLKKEGKKPYVIPRGGRSLFGTAGYFTATIEIYHQLLDIGIKASYFVLPVASTGTITGLILGSQALSLENKVLGFSVLRYASDAKKLIMEEIEKDAISLGYKFPLDREKFDINDSYIGDGYAIPSKEGMQAMKLLARTEGILLDPTYTGKAMAGLIDMIRKGYFHKDDKIVFIHTGGLPILFADYLADYL